MDLIGGVKRGLLERQAEYNFSSSNYEAAAEEYERLLKIVEGAKDADRVMAIEERLGDCYEKFNHQSHEERIKDHKKACEHYLKAADKHRNRGEYEKAGLLFEKSAKAFEEFDANKEAGDFYKQSATMFSKVGDYVNASYAYHSAAERYEMEGENAKAASTYQESALSDMRVKDNTSASDSFKKAAASFEKIREWDKAIDSYASSVGIDTMSRRFLEVADTYEKMANVFYEMNDQEKAVYYHLKSADLRLVNDDPRSAANCMREAGTVYEHGGDYDKAIEYYLKSAKTFFNSNTPAQEAFSYSKAASIYEMRGEYEASGNYYLEAAKSNKAGQNDSQAKDTYMKAAQMFSKASEKNDQDRMKAADFHLKAASSYSEIEEYDKAADEYNSYANIFHEAKDIDNANEGYNRAAQEYVKGGRIWEAAEAYTNRKDYEKAAELYDKYANSKIESRDNFGAGLGFMEGGNCQRRLKIDSSAKAKFDRAASYFAKFIEEAKNKDQTSEHTLLLADAYRKIGECNEGQNELILAKQHYEKAEEYYDRAGDKEKRELTMGLRLKVDGIKAIDHGYYPKAEELLTQSKEILQANAKNGTWKTEYSRILQDGADEALQLIEKIMLKPEIILDIDRYTYTFADMPVMLNVKLTNDGKYTMKQITFLEHLPEEIKLMKLPDSIPELKPTNSKNTYIELTPKKTGLFRVKPIEIYYEDQKAHKYVKASNEVALEVVEKPLTDFKNYINSVEIFHRYAQSQENNNNWFQAGDGYMQMARIYSRFRSDETRTGYYKKAVENYKKYFEENKNDEEKEDNTLAKRLGDSYWHTGEGLMDIGQLDDAIRAYDDSRRVYTKCGIENLAYRSSALKLKVEGIEAVKRGDYTTAQGKFNEALAFFNDVIRSGGFDEEMLRFLEKNEDDVKSMIKTLQLKPQISVNITCPEKVTVGLPVTLNASIYNSLDFTVKSVKPMPNIIEGVEVAETTTDIKEIKPQENANATFKLVFTRPGAYRFTPMDVSYSDDTGKSFIKEGNEVTLTAEVSKSPKKEGKRTPASAKEAYDDGAPTITLDFGGLINTAPGQETSVKGNLSNVGTVDVRNIRFIGSSGPVIELIETPQEVETLQAGKKTEVEIRFRAVKEGVHTVKLLGFSYKDLKGSHFFKSANETAVKVTSTAKEDEKIAQDAKAQEDVKDLLEAGLAQADERMVELISTKADNHAQAILTVLEILVNKRGMGGVYISVSQPSESIANAMKEAGIPDGNVRFIDCISRSAGRGQTQKTDNTAYIENPSSLEEVTMYIDLMLKAVQKPKKFIVLDSISSLLIYNPDKSVREFTHFVINKVKLEKNTGIILSIEKKEAEDLIKTIAPMCDAHIRL
ncbi:MAG: hypothetical protein V1875_01760 [Candidatus Altiarchaeota archaeon]